MRNNSPISTRSLDRGAMAVRTRLDRTTTQAWTNHMFGLIMDNVHKSSHPMFGISVPPNVLIRSGDERS